MEFPGYLHPAEAGQSCQSFYTLLFGTCTFRALPATAAQVLSHNGRGGKQQDKPNPPVLYRLLNCSFPSAAFTPLKAALLCEDVSVFSHCILFVTPFLVLEAPSLIFIQVEKSTDFLRIFLLLMCITKSFHPSTSPSFPCCFAGERSTAACPQSQRVFLCPVYFFCVHPLLTQQEGEGWPPTPAGRALLPAQYKTESAQPNQDSSVLNIQA